jgi:hypothetical protein
MPKASEQERKVGTESPGPGRRGSVHGGCVKRVPAFHAPAHELAPPLGLGGRNLCLR